MPDVLIRDMPEAVKRRLAERAKRHGRSLSAEACAVIAESVGAAPTARRNVAEELRAAFAGVAWSDDLAPLRDVAPADPARFD